MINKKSLCEVFEFFPDAQWITKDKGKKGLISIHREKPKIERTWSEYDHWESNLDTVSEIDSSILKIDWQHRKTWKERCVSRAEIMDGEGEACMYCGKTIVNSPNLVCYKCGDLL